MGRKGDYIGGSTIVGPSGSWPTLDPADPASEIMSGKKGGKPLQRRKKHKRRGRPVRRSKEERTKDQIKESFVTNDVIPSRIARSLIEKRIQQIRRERFVIARDLRNLAGRPPNNASAIKALEAKLSEEDRFLLKCANELEVLKREIGNGIPYWKLQRYGIIA
jgi:hypothetical protein